MKHRKRPRSVYSLYIWIAVIAAATIGVTAYVNFILSGLYTQSTLTVERWSEKVARIDALQRRAGDLARPFHEVISEGRPALREQVHFQLFARTFREEAVIAQRDTVQGVERAAADRITKEFTRVQPAADAECAVLDQVMALLVAGRAQEALRLEPAVNRAALALQQQLENVSSSANEIWRDATATQKQEAALVQWFEYGLVLLLIVVVVGSSFYARRLAQEVAISHERGLLLDELRARDAEMQRLNSTMHMILNSAADGIFGTDINGKAIFINEAGASMLGYGVDEIVGRSMHALTHHSHVDGTPYAIETCPMRIATVEGTVTSRRDECMWRKDGTPLAVEYVASPLRDPNGTLTGSVVSFRDVSARRAVEKMKDEFVSVVSHELRTPLTSIRGALGLIAGGRLGDLPEKVQRMLTIAVTNTDRLVRLINDILDLERIDSGKITLNLARCAVKDVVGQAIEVVRPIAEKAQIRIDSSVCDGYVLADSDRIVQTITNLVGNAIKFSAPQTTVSVSAFESGANDVTIEVADQGRGIPADKLETIFERFQQVDASDSRDKGGSGLGLTICRSIVQQHGGRISVSSELGRGSRFSFILQRSEPVRSTVTSYGRTIAICDDDSGVRAVLQTLLEQHGYNVVPFASGRELLDSPAAADVDAIILDLVMPGMNGWQTMRALKERSDTADVPIIIASVLGQEETATECKGKVAGWVQKPLNEERLVSTVETALGSDGRECRVLLVEDDVDLARVIAASFERYGVRIVHAATGGDAITLAQHVTPDLVVLDLALPGIDGFGVVRWLKEHDLHRNVPLVVYSATEPTPAQRQSLELGPTEFLVKSRVSPDEFDRRVLGILDTIVNTKGRMTHVA